jgi:hypothetical protein
MASADTNEIDVAELRIRLFEARDQAAAMLEQRDENALAEAVRIATASEFTTTMPTGQETTVCILYFGALSAEERLPILYLEALWVHQVASDTIAQIIFSWVHHQPIRTT